MGAKMAEEAMYQGETIAENIWRDLVGRNLRLIRSGSALIVLNV